MLKPLKCKKTIVNLFLGNDQKFSQMSKTTAFWDREQILLFTVIPFTETEFCFSCQFEVLCFWWQSVITMCVV